MPSEVLPPFEEADKTPGGNFALVYRFKPKDESMWVVAHDWADVEEVIRDAIEQTFDVQRSMIPRVEYEDLREPEVRFDGW